MQLQQIKERLSQIELYVDEAARACQTSQGVPDEVRQAIDALERESDSARQLTEVETADDRFIECVDRLEELSDRAKRSCNETRILDPRVQSAVTQAHDQISTLKHQLH